MGQRTLILFLGLMIYGVAHAKPASPNLEKLFQEFTKTCAKFSPPEFEKKLEDLSTQVEHHVAGMKEAEINALLTSNKHEGFWLLYIWPQIIPQKVAFSGLMNRCSPDWLSTTRAIQNRKKAEAKESLKDWKECLEPNPQDIPPQVQSIFSCYDSVIEKL